MPGATFCVVWLATVTCLLCVGFNLCFFAVSLQVRELDVKSRMLSELTLALGVEERGKEAAQVRGLSDLCGASTYENILPCTPQFPIACSPKFLKLHHQFHSILHVVTELGCHSPGALLKSFSVCIPAISWVKSPCRHTQPQAPYVPCIPCVPCILCTPCAPCAEGGRGAESSPHSFREGAAHRPGRV